MPFLREVLSHGPTFTPAQLDIMREAYETGLKELGDAHETPEDRMRFAEVILALMSATPMNGAPELTPDLLRDEAITWFRLPRSSAGPGRERV